ncbi:DUF4124 domain-containing protein [Hahella sp. SMD15-11]|uniref:DUF4124 domain-containing protein n=1 Tax=Thermohahella caldifontis TaxID=3142973 RepID=A0AB39UV19_9GAMM
MTTRTWLCIALGLTILNAQAEIYRWVDPQGNVEYSDSPREGAEKVELPPVQIISLPKASEVPSRPRQTPPEPPALPYKTLKIRFPEDQSAFFSGDGNVTVLVDMDPPLQPGHFLQAVLDGQPVPASGGVLVLNNVYRGTHSLKVNVMRDGQVIQSTPAITFTIQRPRVRR